MQGSSNKLAGLYSFREFRRDPDFTVHQVRASQVGLGSFIVGAYVSGIVAQNIHGVPGLQDQIQTTQAHIDQLVAQEESMRQNPETTPQAIIDVSTQEAIGRYTLAGLRQQRHEVLYSSAPEVFLSRKTRLRRDFHRDR